MQVLKRSRHSIHWRSGHPRHFVVKRPAQAVWLKTEVAERELPRERIVIGRGVIEWHGRLGRHGKWRYWLHRGLGSLAEPERTIGPFKRCWLRTCLTRPRIPRRLPRWTRWGRRRGPGRAHRRRGRVDAYGKGQHEGGEHAATGVKKKRWEVRRPSRRFLFTAFPVNTDY